MNKFISPLLFLSAFFQIGSAIAQSEFTCEKIKDKATRASCIESRVEKEKINAEEVKVNDLDNFVRKSKESLIRNYLDPSAAQFTNLVVVDDTKDKLRHLCGRVNGKNSYGGYIGALMFTVTWSNLEPSQPAIVKIWTEGDGERKRASNERISSDPRFLEANKLEKRATMYEDAIKMLEALGICTETYSEYMNYFEVVLRRTGLQSEYTQDMINEDKIKFDNQHSYRKYIRVR